MSTRSNCLVEAVLTSTHNLCFGVKIRKVGLPLHISVFFFFFFFFFFLNINVGFKGIYIARTCFPDADESYLADKPPKLYLKPEEFFFPISLRRN